MSTSAIIETVMFELDCLLDTRFGTIRKMDAALADKLYAPEYIRRDEDKFEGVDPVVYRKMYDERDEETLKCSTITAFVPRLKDLTQFLSVNAVARPEYSGIKIAVNVYPYRLSESVLQDIRQCVSAWCGGFVPVELINIPPEHLSPRFVKEKFATMVMYDYGKWMGKHRTAFGGANCTEVQLIAPALYFNEKPDDKALNELVREAAHPFQAAMMLGGQVIGLDLIDIKYFSVVVPPHFETQAAPTQSTTNTATA
jgi:hypothetical protein